MNDSIAIAVFAEEKKDKNGRKMINRLYIQKYKLPAGQRKSHCKINIEKEMICKQYNLCYDPRLTHTVDRKANNNIAMPMSTFFKRFSLAPKSNSML